MCSARGLIEVADPGRIETWVNGIAAGRLGAPSEQRVPAEHEANNEQQVPAPTATSKEPLQGAAGILPLESPDGDAPDAIEERSPTTS